MAEVTKAKAVHGRPPLAPDDEHGYFIGSLGRGLAILAAFSPQRTELSLRDIGQIAGVSQPSAFRLGYTLVQSGYLVRNPVSKGYRLGPQALSVAMSALSSMPLPEIAEPFLQDLRDRTHETVKLAVHSGPAMSFLTRMPSVLHPPAGRYSVTSLPIHASSLGRAILAWLPSGTAARLVRDAADAPLTARTPSKAEALRELPAIRRRGYALNDRGVTTENRAVAAPLLDASGAAVGAINLSVSARRISMTELETRMAPLVVKTAQAISGTLPPHVSGAGWISQGE